VAELQAPVAAVLSAQIACVDRELAQLAAAETPLGAQLRTLVSIPGLGHASVATTSKYLHARPTDSSARYLGMEPARRR
jgi:hypothetical protein